MAGGPRQRSRLLLLWEGLATWKQLLTSFPPLAVLLLFLNFGLLGQPLGRSIVYGLLEGGFFAGLLAVATAGERGRRH